MTDCETGTDVPGMVDASPMATSSQDVSRSGDHADTVSTTPESAVSTNVGGPVNQTSSSSSAPSNLYQLNPVADSVADETSGDLSSTTSSFSSPSSNAVSDPAMADNNLKPTSLNAAQLDQLNLSATSTSSSLSQAADNTQLASTNSGDFDGVSIDSDPRTPNPVSAFDDGFQNSVLSGNGDLTMSRPSVQAVSSQASTVLNTLAPNLNNGAAIGSIGTSSNTLGSILIPQNGAIALPSIQNNVLSGNGDTMSQPSVQAVSSQASTVLNTLAPNVNNGAAIASIGTSVVANILGSNSIPQNGAIALSSIQNNVLSGNGDTMSQPSVQAVSSQASTVLNTLAPNLNQNGAAIGSIGTNAVTVANTLIGSNLIPQNGANIALPSDLGTIPQNGAIRLPSGDLEAIEPIGTKEVVNTFGPNLIPQNGAILPSGGLGAVKSIGTNAVTSTLGLNLIPQNGAIRRPSGLDAAGSIGTNVVVNTLSDLIPQNNDGAVRLPNGLDAMGSVRTNAMENTLGSDFSQNGAIRLPSGLGAIGTDIVGISTIPMSSLTSSFGPVQAAPNTISDPSFTNSPDNLNTPRISNGVETSPDHIEANTATTTTTGNCMCNL